MPASKQTSYVPTHRDFIVEFAPGDFRSSLKSLKAFQPGEVLTVFKGLTRGVKAYSSVQCGRGPEDHVELNSDLVYINHSCEPNVAFDLSSPKMEEWHIRALKPIKVSDEVAFFYPSTEWDMAQAFPCDCGAQSCLGSIQGAKYVSRPALLERGFVNPWILELVAERDATQPTRPQTALSRL